MNYEICKVELFDLQLLQLPIFTSPPIKGYTYIVYEKFIHVV